VSGDLAATVAANVRDIRRGREITLAELAARTEQAGRPIALNTLSRVERGSRPFTVAELDTLADCLMVEPVELLGQPPSVSVDTLRVLYDALMHRGHEGTRAPCDVCDALDTARRVLAGDSA